MSAPVLAATVRSGAMHASTLFLAQPEGADPGSRGEGFGKSTPLGLLLLVLFLIAVAFLIRSMTKHLKRLPKSFDASETTDSETTDSGTTTGAGVEVDHDAGRPASTGDGSDVEEATAARDVASSAEEGGRGSSR